MRFLSSPIPAYPGWLVRATHNAQISECWQLLAVPTIVLAGQT
jgi:hypothetical protein